MEWATLIMLGIGLIGAALSFWCVKRIGQYRAQIMRENQDAISKIRSAVWNLNSLDDVYTRRRELADVLSETGIKKVTLSLRNGGTVGIRLSNGSLQIFAGQA